MRVRNVGSVCDAVFGARLCNRFETVTLGRDCCCAVAVSRDASSGRVPRSVLSPAVGRGELSVVGEETAPDEPSGGPQFLPMQGVVSSINCRFAMNVTVVAAVVDRARVERKAVRYSMVVRSPAALLRGCYEAALTIPLRTTCTHAHTRTHARTHAQLASIAPKPVRT
jgi:hypothetical protein